MQNKEVLGIISLSLILLLSISIVSAFSFSDFFNTITGKAAETGSRPVISSTSPSDSTISATTNQQLSFSFSATDADSDLGNMWIQVWKSPSTSNSADFISDANYNNPSGHLSGNAGSASATSGTFSTSFSTTGTYYIRFAVRDAASSTFTETWKTVVVSNPVVSCTSYTYSAWSSCSNGQQTRTISTRSPAGCTGDTGAVTTQSCTSTPSQVSCNSYSSSEACLSNVTCAWDQETNKCINYSPGINSCSDPDNGLNINSKAHTFGYRSVFANDEDKRIRTGGLDSCVSSNYLKEHYCSEAGTIETSQLECNYGCSDGACKSAPNASGPKIENIVCSDFLTQIAYPSDFTEYGNEYILYWNGTYKDEYTYINNEKEKYTEYYASWTINNEEKYNYLFYDVSIFENKNVDLESWLDEAVSYRICDIQYFWGSDNQENKIYICNWEILSNQQQNLDLYQYESRQALWINKNVLVRIDTTEGRAFTEEEIAKLSQKRINSFLTDLKNNQLRAVEWDSLNIGYPLSDRLSSSLTLCKSTIDLPVNKKTNETCDPYWNCKLEPSICPPHGYQTRICVDYSCDKKQEQQVSCSPGLCSGCSVPKWFGYADDTKCIPYGFRFEAESGTSIKLVEETNGEILDEGQDGSYSLKVISETEAILVLYGENGLNYSYNLTENTKTDITEGFIAIEGDGDSDGLISAVILTNSVDIGDSENKGSVKITINFIQNRETIDTFNAYCDIDGQVKAQKTKYYDGSWASCQNNYECASNVCSNGECIEVNDLIAQGSGLKSMFTKMFCRITNLFDNNGYDLCLSDNS